MVRQNELLIVKLLFLTSETFRNGIVIENCLGFMSYQNDILLISMNAGDISFLRVDLFKM